MGEPITILTPLTRKVKYSFQYWFSDIFVDFEIGEKLGARAPRVREIWAILMQL